MTTTTKESIHELLTISIPKEIAEDLERIASFKETTVDELLYSYITEGAANDSLAARRKEFTDKANEVLSKKNMPPKTVEDIEDLVY